MSENIEYIGPIFPKVNQKFSKPNWWEELEDNRPVILINQGTIATDCSELILPAIKAFGNQNFLVIALPVKEEIKNLPVNVKVSEFISFGHLLPYVDVMITNGGFGATYMALSHGIPLVCSGNSEDKKEVGSRVEYTGCGINLNQLSPSPTRIKKAVDSILSNSSYKKQAEKLQAEIRGYNILNLIINHINSLI